MARLPKQLICVAIVLLLLVVLYPLGNAMAAEPATDITCYLHGDVNGDGTVNSDDAIYTLYLSFGTPGYVAYQDCNFDGSGDVSSDDAIYLLYASFMTPGYDLNGLVHSFYDPAWSWNDADMTAVPTFRCACGAEHDQGEVTVETKEQKATCTAVGMITCTAKVTCAGVEYTNTKVYITGLALGHSMDGSVDCENGSSCARCDYELPALGHNYVLNAEKCEEATCETNAVEVYECANCHDEKREEILNTKGQHKYVLDREEAGAGCLVTPISKCEKCGGEIEGVSYYEHSYSYVLTKEANCKDEGKLSYICGNKDCGHEVVENAKPIPADETKHIWDAGVEANGVITYTCSVCGGTKTAVVANKETGVDKETLGSVGEVALENGTSMSMDQEVIESLPEENVILSAEIVDPDTITLPEGKEDMIDEVYDFDMVSSLTGEKVEFEGSITVTVPYTLQEGEDVEWIDVWYIDDKGEYQSIRGEYANGYVTFTVEHFSYYTVTRLTAKQRCELYGHVENVIKLDATCQRNGYEKHVCLRCGQSLGVIKYPMLDHKYEETRVEPTCTEEGSLVKTCSVCKHKVTSKLPAKGHTMEVVETVEASCDSEGRIVSKCACGHESVETSPQKAHNYILSKTQDVSCTENGFELYTCEHCGHEKKENQKIALGHKYGNAQWNWDADACTGTLVLTCEHDAAHTITLNATVTETRVEPTCEKDGLLILSGKVIYNNRIYVSRDDKAGYNWDYEAFIPATGHNVTAAWSSDANVHYHVCSKCDARVDEANHAWDDGFVSQQPTCNADGSAKYTCNVCGYERTDVLPATGKHNFVNGVCTYCGNKMPGSSTQKITVWVPEQIVELTIEQIARFNESNPDGIYIDAVVGAMDSYTAANNVRNDLENAADMYLFSQDQTELLAMSGALSALDGTAAEWVLGTNAAGAAQAATYGKDLWAYPMTAHNGYFMYYDKRYISEDSLDSLTAILADCKANGKYFGMETNNSWYLASWFFATGCHSNWILNESGEFIGVDDDFNSANGLIALKGLKELLDSGVHMDTSEAGRFESGAAVLISGTWNYESAKAILGDNLGMTDLPSFTVDGKDYHMSSFGGYNLLGVKPQADAEREDALHKLAQFLSSEECQVERYEYNNMMGPANLDAQQSEAVKADPALDALNQQNLYAVPQGLIHGSWWDIARFIIGVNTQSATTDAELMQILADYEKEINALFNQTKFEYSVIGSINDSMWDEDFPLYRQEDGSFLSDVLWMEAGSEFKIRKNQAWDENYGLGGGLNGANIVVETSGYYRVYFRLNGSSAATITLIPEGGDVHQHNWIVSVHVNATCVSNGYIDYFCDGCDETMSEVLLATGRHDYVNGICSVCDKQQPSADDCNHNKLDSQELVDVSGMNVCDGLNIFKVSCQCGLNVKYELAAWSCEIDENGIEIIEKVDDTGNPYQVQIGHCKNCDMWAEVQEAHKVLGTEECALYYREYQAVWIGDVLVMENEDLELAELHPLVNVTEVIQLTQESHGVCGYTFHKGTCPCGESERVEWVGRDCPKGVYLCPDCNSSMWSSGDTKRDPETCTAVVSTTYTLIRGDDYYNPIEVLYTITDSSVVESHDTVIVDFVLDGTSCEDGVTYYFRCNDCGLEYNEYYNHHEALLVEKEVTLGEEYCIEKIQQMSCACGKGSKNENLVYSGDYCNFEYREENGREVWVCSKCGLKQTYEYFETEPDENCKAYEGWRYTYYAADGTELITTVQQEAYTRHTMEYSFTLLGDSCEDGVEITETCVKCGESYSWTTNSHETFEKEVVDLSQYGFCPGSKLVIRGCACGYDEWMNLDGNCAWEYMGGSENSSYQECLNCGGGIYEHFGESVEIAPCRYAQNVTVEISMGGQTVEKLSYRSVNEQHAFIYELTLNEGATSCEDGYTATRYCQDCGLVAYTEEGNEHNGYRVREEIIAEGQLCGDLHLVTSRCACGEYEESYTSWWNDSCSFMHTGYDEELGADMFVCERCGVTQAHIRQEILGENCSVVIYEQAIYYKDGVEIGRYEVESTQYHHNYLYTFSKGVVNCEDGYNYTATCLNCDHVETGFWEHHSNQMVDRVLIQEATDTCDALYVERYSCACGREGDLRWEGSCQWNWVGKGYDNTETYQCNGCGLMYTDTVTEIPGVDHCHTVYDHTRTYLRDGEVVKTIHYQTVSENHMWVYDLTLNEGATSCEDGFTVHRYCYECGMNDGTWRESGHRTYGTLVQKLDAPNACGDVYLVISGCACGKNQSVQIISDCQWGYYDKGKSSGYEETECYRCGLRAIYETTYSEGETPCQQNCTQTVTIYNGETVLGSLSATAVEETHTWKNDFEFLNGGTSCTDGVQVNQSCIYCDAANIRTVYHHEWFRTVYNLADYGGCSTDQLTVMSCACGYESSIAVEGNYFGGRQMTEYMTCGDCGITLHWMPGQTVRENCRAVTPETMEVIMDEKVVLSLDYIRAYQHHRTTYYVQLNGESCTDGYTYIRQCRDCGVSFDQGEGSDHNTFCVDSQYIGSGIMCNEVTVNYYSCACGQETEVYTGGDDSCEYESLGKGADGWENYQCRNCGVIKTQQYIQSTDGCQISETRTVRYIYNNVEIGSYTGTNTWNNHEYVFSFENGITNCEDGYQYTRTCVYCGVSESGTWYHHSSEVMDRQVIREATDTCEEAVLITSGCACGQYYRQYVRTSCNFEYVENFNSKETTFRCINCGLERYEYSTSARDEEIGCVRHYTRYYRYVFEGQELCTYEEHSEGYSHSYLRDFTMLGATCDDGYTMKGTCFYCGETREYNGVYYGCENFLVAYQILDDGTNLCYELGLRTYSCPCGKEAYSTTYWPDRSCSWNHVEYNPELGCHIYECSTCGTQRYEYDAQREAIEGESCAWNRIQRHSYFKNGVELFTVENSERIYTHQMVTTYHMQGTTCEDGYFRTDICQDCGYTVEHTEPEYGHHTYTVESHRIDLDENACGQIHVYTNRCACGKEEFTDFSWYTSGSCSFWHEGEVTEDGYSVATCQTCGLVRLDKQRINQLVEGETCKYESGWTYIFIRDGVELGRVDTKRYQEEHADVATFSGNDCSVDYTVSNTCQLCGRVDSHTTSGHIAYVVERETLVEGNGTCGKVEKLYYSCACGDECYYSLSQDTRSCVYSDTPVYDEYAQNWHTVCVNCGIWHNYGNFQGEAIPGSCEREFTFHYYVSQFGEPLVEADITYLRKVHINIHEFVMNGATCEEGYEIIRKCVYCGEQERYAWSSGHNTYRVEYIDLALYGGCGGYVERNSCPCGIQSRVEYYVPDCAYDYDIHETGDRFNGTCVETLNCTTCGLSIQTQKSWTTADGSCETVTEGSTLVKIGDLERVLNIKQTNYDNHDWSDPVYTLNEGSVTCEDGITGVETCQRCGQQNSWERYGHTWNTVELIDLRDYGATCEGYLRIQECPCGAMKSVNNEWGCDMDHSYGPIWVEGAMEGGQDNADGYHYLNSNCTTYTCAVTDPQCTMKIRYGHYYMQSETDPCYVDSYVVYQIGYDEATGTCLREIVLKTEKAMLWHDYVREDLTSYYEDGVLKTGGYRDVCANCGSSYMDMTSYDTNGNQSHNEVEMIHTLEDGEYNRYVHNNFEFEIINNYAEPVLARYDVTYADGSTYWQQYDYTYDYTEGCKRIEHYTDSNGEDWTNEYEWHDTTSWTYETLEEPTCSQYGTRREYAVCNRCNQITEDYQYSIGYKGHSWNWNDEKQTYVCSVCSLENINGADGSIVLEDMSAAWGNGVNTVVGYGTWREISDFNPYLSVILYDAAEGENDELVIDYADFLYLTKEADGINALSYNTAAVQAAAEAAIANAGYSGSFAIRISFVPVDGDDTLDYAITFDTQNAK